MSRIVIVILIHHRHKYILFICRLVKLLSENCILQTVGSFGRVTSLSRGRYLHRTTQTKNKCRHTSMPTVGFEPNIWVGKIFRDLGCSASVIGVGEFVS
jgi:hypothetical protein